MPSPFWVGLGSPNRLHPRWRVVIEAFFDDSGQENGAFFCVAGFLADQSYWNAFLLDWHHLLRRWNIQEVHMKLLWSSNGPFKGWDETKKRQAVSEFVDVIRKHKLIGYGVAVDTKFWGSLPKDFRKAHGSAAEFCFERVIRRIRDNMVLGHDRDFIALTFDHDRDFAKPRLTRLQNIIDRDPWAKDTIVSIGFGRAWAYAPLQAADMLAWETNRLLQVNTGGARPSFGSETMFAGPDGIEFTAGEYWDKHEFEKYVDIRTGGLKSVLA